MGRASVPAPKCFIIPPPSSENSHLDRSPLQRLPDPSPVRRKGIDLAWFFSHIPLYNDLVEAVGFEPTSRIIQSLLSFTSLVRILTPLELTVVTVRLGRYAILGSGFLHGPPLGFTTTKKTFFRLFNSPMPDRGKVTPLVRIPLHQRRPLRPRR